MASLKASAVCILLVCVLSVTRGNIHQVHRNFQQGLVKIDDVIDLNLRAALDSVQSYAYTVKQLDLSANAISQISSNDLSAFSNLELLNLSTNVLTETVDLRALNKLQTLDLNNNFNIERVVVGPAVKILFAANNRIINVQCPGNSIAGKKFDIANNKINILQDLDSSCRTGLEELNLELNEIDIINFRELSESTRTLKVLNLAYNYIFDVVNTNDNRFASLKTLDLSSNKLAFMGTAFMAASQAERISLANNKLVLIDEKLRLSGVKQIDMSGNGFQCSTLDKFFGANVNVPRGNEQCANKLKKAGYCCEDLSAPFADRLIALKRREHTLHSDKDPEQERLQCEKDNSERQKKILAFRSRYHTQVSEGVRLEQERVELSKAKAKYEVELSQKQEIVNDLQELLRNTSGKLDIRFQDSVQAMHDIAAKYDQRYRDEQLKQNLAIKDWENYHQQVVQMEDENKRLLKQLQDAEAVAQAANATLITLEKKEAELSAKLTKAQA